MKKLGSLSTFLGIRAIPSPSGVLTQEKYAHDILQQAGMTSCHLRPTPLAIKTTNTTEDQLPYSNPTNYRQLVGLSNTSPSQG